MPNPILSFQATLGVVTLVWCVAAMIVAKGKDDE